MLQIMKLKNINRKTPQYFRSINYQYSKNQKQHLAKLNLQISNQESNNHHLNPQLQTTFNNFYKTQGHSWKPSHIKHKNHQHYRIKRKPLKQSVVGIPFRSLDFVDKNNELAVFSQLDRQRCNYLLKAISGMRNGKKLSQIRYQNEQNKFILNSDSHHIDNKFHQSEGSLNKQLNYNLKEEYHKNVGNNTIRLNSQNLRQKVSPALKTPKIVNITSKLKTRKNNRSLSIEKDNQFEKMFKNKRKLQNKIYNAPQDDRYEITILGEYQLTIHQAPFSLRSQK